MLEEQTQKTEFKFPDQYPGLEQGNFAQEDDWKAYIMSQKIFIGQKELMEKLELSLPTIKKKLKPYVKHIVLTPRGIVGEYSVFFDKEDLEKFLVQSENISRRSIHINIYAYPDIISKATIAKVQEFLQLTDRQKRKAEALRQALKKDFYPFFVAHCKEGTKKIFEQCASKKCTYDDTTILDKLKTSNKNIIKRIYHSDNVTQVAFYNGWTELKLPGKTSNASSRWFIQDQHVENIKPYGEPLEQWVLVGYVAWCEFYLEHTGTSFEKEDLSALVSSDMLADDKLKEQKNNEEENINRTDMETYFSKEKFKELTEAVLNKHIKRLFITGEAGTGKTAYLCYLIKKLREQGRKILLCASTGSAANNLNQQFDEDTGISCSTVHNAFAITEPIVYGQYATKSISKLENIIGSDVIIIDEISMLRMDTFSKVMGEIAQAEEECAKRNIEEDLCHKQVIVVGDFFQLPPVIKKRDVKQLVERGWPQDWVDKGGYCFFSPLWDFLKVELQGNFRHQDDPELREHLAVIRVGDEARLNQTLKWLNSPNGSLNNNEKLRDVISIVDKKEVAEKINQNCLKQLAGPVKEFLWQKKMSCKGEKQLEELNVREKLLLKVGAKVIATKNDKDKRYFNGFMGTVVELGDDFAKVNFYGKVIKIERVDFALTDSEWHYDKNANNWQVTNKNKAIVSQLPLELAYAITIHKAQGMTFTEAKIVPNGWAYGQLYTALSRVKSKAGLHLQAKIMPDYVKTSPEVVQFYAGEKLSIAPEPKKRIYPSWEALGSILTAYGNKYMKAVTQEEKAKWSEKITEEVLAKISEDRN